MGGVEASRRTSRTLPMAGALSVCTYPQVYDLLLFMTLTSALPLLPASTGEQYRPAVDILRAMQANGHAPNMITITLVIDACERAGKPDTAVRPPTSTGGQAITHTKPLLRAGWLTDHHPLARSLDGCLSVCRSDVRVRLDGGGRHPVRVLRPRQERARHGGRPARVHAGQ